MTSFSSTPRPVFIYNSADDVWYEVSAKADTPVAPSIAILDTAIHISLLMKYYSHHISLILISM